MGLIREQKENLVMEAENIVEEINDCFASVFEHDIVVEAKDDLVEIESGLEKNNRGDARKINWT